MGLLELQGGPIAAELWRKCGSCYWDWEEQLIDAVKLIPPSLLLAFWSLGKPGPHTVHALALHCIHFHISWLCQRKIKVCRWFILSRLFYLFWAFGVIHMFLWKLALSEFLLPLHLSAIIIASSSCTHARPNCGIHLSKFIRLNYIYLRGWETFCFCPSSQILNRV